MRGWKILQHKKPDDFVLAIGKQISIIDFIVIMFKIIKLKSNNIQLNEKILTIATK